MERKIIDVSEWQGVIDWNKAKTHIDGVILRCGCGTSYDDKQWKRNVAECERLGIPYGVYLYSYAKDTNAAKKEAEHVLRMIAGHKLSYPVYFDAEQGGTEKVCNQTAKVFCETVEGAGYFVGIYSTAYWFAHYLKVDGRYTRWVAAWGTNNGQPQKRPNVENMGMWQYTSVGKIDGVNGNVDVSLCYLNIDESEDDDMTDERVREIVHEILDGNNTKPSEWAEKEVAEAKTLGITDGSRPQGYARREEVAAMILRDHNGIVGIIADAVKHEVKAVLEKIKGVLPC
jgi:lysozyme